MLCCKSLCTSLRRTNAYLEVKCAEMELLGQRASQILIFINIVLFILEEIDSLSSYQQCTSMTVSWPFHLRDLDKHFKQKKKAKQNILLLHSKVEKKGDTCITFNKIKNNYFLKECYENSLHFLHTHQLV